MSNWYDNVSDETIERWSDELDIPWPRRDYTGKTRRNGSPPSRGLAETENAKEKNKQQKARKQ